ncbi:MAG: hypothetical protein ACI8YQ_002535 [Polaribacter sp.]|jgi:hypothetical protein
MKTYPIIFFIGLLSFNFLGAQSISPSVIVPDGAVSKTENISLEWTLGEVMTHTVTHENRILTQGSHQPILQFDLTGLKGEESTSNTTDIQIFPNPVQRMLTINFSSDEDKEMDVVLFDLNGKRLIETSGNTNLGQLQVNMEYLPAGLYFLRFEEQNGSKVKTFQVTKIDDK